MRLEFRGTEVQSMCWLTDEREELRRAATSHRDDLVIQLGGYVGLRAFEIPKVEPRHIKQTEDGEHYRLRVHEGKDTSVGAGKPRNAYLPPDVERDLHQYQCAKRIDQSESLIELSERGIRAVVKRTAGRAADETGTRTFNT